MTVKELSRLYQLNREIELNIKQLDQLTVDMYDDEQLLCELRGAVEAGAIAPPNMSGMPRSPGTGNPTEKTALRIIQVEQNIRRKRDTILDLRVAISTRQTLCLLERKRLEEYIDGIDDEFLRQVFTLRFVNGLPWEQVAASIGGGNKAESVRVSCYRYLQQRNAAERCCER